MVINYYGSYSTIVLCIQYYSYQTFSSDKTQFVSQLDRDNNIDCIVGIGI